MGFKNQILKWQCIINNFDALKPGYKFALIGFTVHKRTRFEKNFTL